MKSVPTATPSGIRMFRKRPLPTPASPINIQSGERVVWAGTGHPRPVMIVGQVVATGANVLIGVLASRWEFVIAAGAMICVWLLLDRVSVTVGPFGMRASMGLLGFPRLSIPIDQIAQVSTLDIKPTRWGGWGYRGSLRAFKRAAMIVRAGEGIRIDLNDGRLFIVTVDDATTGAAVLQGTIQSYENDQLPQR
jgi:hypothetical protein